VRAAPFLGLRPPSLSRVSNARRNLDGGPGTSVVRSKCVKNYRCFADPLTGCNCSAQGLPKSKSEDAHIQVAGRGHVRQLIMGFRITQLIYVAAKLELADHLARGPLTASELAQAVGVDAGALYRLLRALASLGVFAQASSGSFEKTPAAELLRRNIPGSPRSTRCSMETSSIGTHGVANRTQ